MTAFDAGWLDLREPADARARSGKVLRRLRAAVGSPPAATSLRGFSAGRQPQNELTVFDLGGGTGANLRVLAPLLGGRQRWRVIDNDPGLLDAQLGRVAAWARSKGHEYVSEATPAAGSQVDAAAARFAVRGSDFAAEVESSRLDLGTALPALEFAPGDLVTASALLDLVSDEWLAAAIGKLTRAGAAAYFALSYDGRIAMTPAHAVDAQVRSLVNSHQRSDKGFGPALGPVASDTAAGYLRDAGYRVETDTSDWRLDARDRALLGSLIDGWIDAALEVDAAATPRLEQWRSTRREQIAHDRLEVRVGHEDLLALPPG